MVRTHPGSPIKSRTYGLMAAAPEQPGPKFGTVLGPTCRRLHAQGLGAFSQSADDADRRLRRATGWVLRQRKSDMQSTDDPTERGPRLITIDDFMKKLG